MIISDNLEKKIIPQDYRSEIDNLKGIAVFLIIFFHFELFNISGGFIGVDVFFVISGYLITNLLIFNDLSIPNVPRCFCLNLQHLQSVFCTGFICSSVF